MAIINPHLAIIITYQNKWTAFSSQKTEWLNGFNKQKKSETQIYQIYVASGGLGLPGGTSDKEPVCHCRRCKRHMFNPWVRKIPWRREWQPTSVFLPVESRGQRSWADYSPWDHKELDMTKVP